MLTLACPAILCWALSAALQVARGRPDLECFLDAAASSCVDGHPHHHEQCRQRLLVLASGPRSLQDAVVQAFAHSVMPVLPGAELQLLSSS